MLNLKVRSALNTLEPNVEVLEETWARMGAECDYFYAFFIWKGDIYALNVRHTVPSNGWYFRDLGRYHKSGLYLNRFGRSPGGLNKVDQQWIGEGADPRLVSDGTNAYGIITVYRNPGWSATLYDIRRQRLVPIKFSDPSFGTGKNWQPYLLNGELFAVHEMAPLRVLKIDADSGLARIVEERDLGFNLYAFYERYPMFRGGCNAIGRRNEVVGLGRATSQLYRHQPFLWWMQDPDNLNVEFSAFFHRFNKRGYNIVDATSIFFEGEDLLVGLCCTERDWCHEQTVTNLLLRFSPSQTRTDGLPLGKFLNNRPPTEEMRRPLLDRHMFFCHELPGAIPSRPEHGGRISIGAAGHLVHGPYLRLEREGRFTAELSYLTKSNGPGTRAGVFEVTVCQPDAARRLNFRTLGRRDLGWTDGNVGTARIEFDTTGAVGLLLELRVYVDEGVELNAFHIRTSRIDEASAPLFAAAGES